MTEVNPTKSTKIMTYVLYGVLGFMVLIGIGAGLATMGDGSNSSNYSAPSRDSAPF